MKKAQNWYNSASAVCKNLPSTQYNCLEELTIDAIQLLKPGMAVCICNAALRRQGYMVDLYEFEICVLYIESLRISRTIL